MVTAESIAEAVRAAFPEANKQRPTPGQMEQVMRPFAADAVNQRDTLMKVLGDHHLKFSVDHWVEANQVVIGSGDAKERAIRFLVMDTCTCVLDHLRAAMDHATEPIDPRISSLLNHPHFQQKE